MRFATGSGALDYKWTGLRGAEVSEHVGFIGDLQAAANWRGTSMTAVVVTLTRVVSLKVSHAAEYRHVPVAGFKRMDMRTAAALVLSVQRRGAVP